jgi:predicted nuclease of restriction endonuclease-like RecB superfamily
VGGELVPDWLGPADHPWLRDLLDRVEAAVGGTVADLDARLDAPWPRAVPPARLRMAREVARSLLAAEPAGGSLSPAELRAALFGRSSALRRGTAWSRERALAEAAASLGLEPATLEEGLFADLPSERRVIATHPLPDPSGLALRVNAALAACLLHRATTLTLRLSGNARDLVRHLRLQRLLFVARPRPDGVELVVSGPFALFRRTTLYGRAYASILPRLPWCDAFALEARVAWRGGEHALRLGPADPVWPSVPPRRFDSALEERFAKDLAKRFPGWALVREPAPVPAGGVLLFPDFAVHPVDRPDARTFVEIVGFWTPEYLAAKLARLRSVAAGWVVCVDERLDCGADALPDSVSVVRFRRRIDPAEVLARVAPAAPLVTTTPLPASAYFLDWAGRRAPSDPLHARLAALRPGDAVALRDDGDRVVVVDPAGLAIAALSAGGAVAWRALLPRVRGARVRAVEERRAAQSGPAFRGALRAERWRVPLVEVDLAPP